MVMARWSLVGAHSAAAGQAMSLREKVSYGWDIVRFEFGLQVFRVSVALYRALGWLKARLPGRTVAVAPQAAAVAAPAPV